MGVATLEIAAESVPEVVVLMKPLGIAIIGSREGGFRSVFLVVEGKCVPDANMVTAIVHTERTAEKSSLTLTFEERRS